MFFESDYKILSNEKIAKDVYKMRLEAILLISPHLVNL